MVRTIRLAIGLQVNNHVSMIRSETAKKKSENPLSGRHIEPFAQIHCTISYIHDGITKSIFFVVVKENELQLPSCYRN